MIRPWNEELGVYPFGAMHAIVWCEIWLNRHGREGDTGRGGTGPPFWLGRGVVGFAKNVYDWGGGG